MARYLKRIAAESNRELIDLNRLSTGKALEVIRTNEEKFFSCDYNHAELKEVYPDKPVRVNGYLEIAGILVNYYSESRQTITGPVMVYAILYTRYGTKQQQMKHVTIQLSDNKEIRQLVQLGFDR